MKARIRTRASLENEYGISRDGDYILAPNFAIPRRIDGFFGEVLEMRQDCVGDYYAKLDPCRIFWIFNLDAVVEEVIDCQNEL